MQHWKTLPTAVLAACLMAFLSPPLAWSADTPPKPTDAAKPIDAAKPADAAKPEEQLAAAITVGQAQWLEAGGERFLGIYTKATTGTPLGGAIILPDLAVHPDWPDVIAPLRQGLPAYGWNTLSIQLPAPAQGADGLWQLEPYFTAARARIQAAVGFLTQQGITNIALIGHGLGAATAVVSVNGTDPAKVSALAAISLGIPPRSAPSPYQTGLLENIRVPMLDIYGSSDSDEVTKTAAARLAAAHRAGLDASTTQHLEPLKHSAMARLPTTEQNGYIAYRQLELMGADHSFRGAEATLLKRVAGWLKKNAAGVAVPAAVINKG